jgi:hypothetical protein
MPPDEAVEWLAYFQIKNARMEKEAKMAQNKQPQSKRHR